MIPLPDQPVGTFDAATGLWVCKARWACPLTRGRILVIEEGFESDGMSIPRFLWPVVGPRYDARTFPAALCHDALYCAELDSREGADSEFRRLMVAFGSPRWIADACYRAVRWFGWFVWMGHTGQTVAEARQFCHIIDAEGPHP